MSSRKGRTYVALLRAHVRRASGVRGITAAKAHRSLLR